MWVYRVRCGSVTPKPPLQSIMNETATTETSQPARRVCVGREQQVPRLDAESGEGRRRRGQGLNSLGNEAELAGHNKAGEGSGTAWRSKNPVWGDDHGNYRIDCTSAFRITPLSSGLHHYLLDYTITFRITLFSSGSHLSLPDYTLVFWITPLPFVLQNCLLDYTFTFRITPLSFGLHLCLPD